MKKITLLVGLVFLSTSFLLAQTHIPAGNVNGIWNIAGSPYIVDGEIQIIVGDQLTIDPGVDVEFSGHYKFIIYGRLLAEGAAGNTITFTAQTPATGWHGFRFIDTNTNGQDSSKIVYCEIEYGKATGASPDYRGGALYCSNSSDILIQNTSFENNSAVSNGGAVYLYNSDVIFNTVVINNNISTGSGGGLYISNSDPIMTEVIISDNTSTYDGAGISCFNSNPTITSCQIYNNATQWSGGAISCYNNSSPTIDRTTITKNLAYQNGSGIALLYNSDATMVNSIVWNNATNGIYIEPQSNLYATYSDIKDGTGQSYFGTGCINEDPLFADPDNDDFQITWANFPTQDSTKSPCINSGDPNSTPDADGTRADMGALPYLQSGISGTITLQGGTGNILDVEVTAGGVTVNPDINGEYLINLGVGTYSVSATLDGYSADPVNGVVVTAGNVTTDIDITLNEILPGEIVGQVDLEGLGNVTEVLVSAGGESTHPYPVYDSMSGILLYYEYLIELPQGTYDVTATKAGYQDSTITNVVVISGQQNIGNNFLLYLIKYDGWIAGRVTLNGGAGDVTNVEVAVDTSTVNPDATGYYEVLVENGTYEISASLDGYAAVTIGDIEVIANDTTIVDITLLNWDIIPGTQYTMIGYLTCSLDGDYITKTGSNQLAAFGSGGISDCRGVASWQEGDHPLWEGYYPLDGYWYLTMVSNNNSGTDTLSFKVFDTETNTVYDCYEEVVFEDCTINLLDVTAQHEVDQDFSLTPQWNWISLNVHPADTTLSNVLGPLGDDAFQIKNQTQSATYDDMSGTWIGTLDGFSDGVGYLLNMNVAFSPFTVSGYLINPETHFIPLEYDSSAAYNWNWIGYYPNAELTLYDALQSLGNNVIAIKTQSQSAVYVNGLWIGDLTTMIPGVSYKINMGAADTLTYPIATVSKDTPVIPYNYNNPMDWQIVSGADQNMIAMIAFDTIQDQSSLASGIFDEEGNCYGIGTYINKIWYFTIVGDQTRYLHFEAVDLTSGESLSSTETITFENDIILGSTSKPLKISLEPIQHSDTNILLYNNSPNPFHRTTSIRYYLPEKSPVSLEVYNILGQKVSTIVSTSQNAGEYIFSWDGKNDNGNRLSTGIYFYKLTTASSSIVKKMLMIK